jgi:DNA-binding CsgD family transcriptional regulator
MSTISAAPHTGTHDPILPQCRDEVSRTLWSSLCDDTGSEVLILGADGRIVFANPSAEIFFSQSIDARLIGRQYKDLYPSEIASERWNYITEVVRTGCRMVIEGVVRGCWRQTTLRLIRASEPMVLLVKRRTPDPTVTAENAPGVTGRVEPMAGDAGCSRVRAKADDLGRLAELTTREREILSLIGRGLSTNDIAQHLGRSVKTIEWHRVSLGNKLGVSNRVELAHIALRSGLAQINPETPVESDGKKAIATPAE